MVWIPRTIRTEGGAKMKLASYEVTNWGPHTHQKLIFPEDAKTIAICGENDQGKSWILRGIAFTFSIGRNEYGDQTSIHVGEKQAHHKLKISHNGVEYLIEKIVRGKSSEEEGTTTLINGEKMDKAGLESFYSETLGLPHPNVWIPICISMQNQTDFHLRSKKRDREEALRLACQLTKIDAWKDHLSTTIRGEEKEVTQKVTSLKTRVEMVTQQLKELNQSLTKYNEAIKNLSAHKWMSTTKKPLEDSSIQEFWKNLEPTLSQTRDTIKLIKRSELEYKNKLTEIELLTNITSRLSSEISNSVEPKKVQELELKKSGVEIELYKIRMAKTIKTIKSHENSYKKLLLDLNSWKSLESKGEIPKEDNINGKDISKKIITLRILESHLNDEVREINHLIQEGELLLPSITSKPPQILLKRATSLYKLEESSLPKGVQLYKKTKETVAELIAQEKKNLLSENNPKKENLEEIISEFYQKKLLIPLFKRSETEGIEVQDCPLCQTSIADWNKAKAQAQEQKQGSLSDTEYSKLVIETSESLNTLIESKLSHESNQEKDVPEAQNRINKLKKIVGSVEKMIELIRREENILQDSGIDTDLPLKNIIDNLNEEIKNLEEKRKLMERSEIIRREIDFALKQQKEYEKKLEDLIKETQSKGIEINLDEISEDIIPENKEETILDELKKINLKYRELTEAQERVHKKSKELEISKTKKEVLEKNLKHIEDELLRQKTTLINECSLPKPLREGMSNEHDESAHTDPDVESNIQTQEERIEEWSDRLEKYKKLWTLASEIPKNKKRLQTEQLSSMEELEKATAAFEKIQDARKLVEFLDYKKAPRILLEQIVDQLFAVTNKLAESLQVDLSLVQGKNLEFLTHQTRNSKIVEQKTERLGFGKGAILGICFRLACQRLLLPETGFLILDEPTANVDNKRKSALKSFLQSLSEASESRTNQIILIEHDQDVVELCQARLEINSKYTTKENEIL